MNSLFQKSARLCLDTNDMWVRKRNASATMPSDLQAGTLDKDGKGHCLKCMLKDPVDDWQSTKQH